MRHLQKLTIICMLMITLIGCATTLGNGKFPEPSANYVPKKELGISYDKTFSVISNVLEDNRAAIATQDKSTGRITTDYFQGVTQMQALGFLGVIQTRYRYNISVTKISKSKTKVNIICTLESSGDKLTAWRDVSSDNRELVTTLENWLYEQIGIKSHTI